MAALSLSASLLSLSLLLAGAPGHAAPAHAGQRQVDPPPAGPAPRATQAAAAPAEPMSDARIVAEATLVAEGERIALYGHGVQPDRAVLEAAESALAKMEAVLGRDLDTQTLGPRLRIHVSTATTVSHVWRGYEHPEDPQGVLFLNPKVARLGVAGINATYAHELAHLLTWRFHSHTLREGLADYLALQVHPGAAVGPNADASAPPPEVPPEVQALLGTASPPPQAVRDDPAFREAYYHGSRRLVTYLVERAGMEVFLQLYDAPDPEVAYTALYGESRDALVRKALAGD